MSSINSISVDKLARLVGTPKCPALIDVRTEEDFAALPRFIPGAALRPHVSALEWAHDLPDRSAVVICQKGQKLSQGTAAWLRH
ncbi:MAG: sulfurtransferase, partial [Methylobacteriaceae bacterium]|nr:sulfurtransferase [Methylobacteriaceae bacterium]